MSQLQTGALIELASRRKKKPPSQDKDRRLRLDELHPGTYLGADPSLGGFGLVLLEVGRAVTVHLAQQFIVARTVEHSGWEDVLTRADLLAARLEAYLQRWVHPTDWGHLFAVHEAPPIGHGKLFNPEIALITSREFRRATERYPMLAMVRRQDHAKLVCGDPNAAKAVHHRALQGYFGHIDGSDLITNAATRDALSISLYAAQRGFR
jgi:hypothetical protein